MVSWATTPAGMEARRVLGRALADMEMEFLEEKVKGLTEELKRESERLRVPRGKWHSAETRTTVASTMMAKEKEKKKRLREEV